MVADKMSKTKRKLSDQEERKTGKKRKSSENEEKYYKDNVFCQVLKKAGLTLKTGKSQNVLEVDQAVFQRNLQIAVKRSDNFPLVLDEFVEGFQEYIEDQHRFHYSLLPTQTSNKCESARCSSQDSLVRLLIGVDILQSKMMMCLLEKLAEFMENEDCIVEHGEKVNLPRLLMSQFRWLDRILDCKELADKMLEMITIVSVDIQREIITCLPEVVEDSEHSHVATSLRDLLVEKSSLTVPILDALSNLNLNPELLMEVRGSVLQTLSTVEMENLPVVIRFLLQSVTPADAQEVVTEIRQNLDFTSSFPLATSTPHETINRRNLSGDETRGVESLTLDAIKSGIRFQKSVAEAWIKAIDSVKQPSDHKVIDLFILLILYSTDRKKPVESLIRNKIRSGAFTEVLLQEAFRERAQVMRDYFPAILSLAEVLLRSPEPAITFFAASMYKNGFVAFDTYCQQEIVGNLVTHFGSGFEGETDSSLDILYQLVDKHLDKMAPFAIFVKVVLDYLDNLSVLQIRKLYSLLSTLAFRSTQGGNMIQDDLHIIIRKQLSNDNPKYKRMGIIGAVMVVKSIAYNQNRDNEPSQAPAGPMTESLYKQVINLLKLVKTSSSRMSEATALFLDELANVVGNGHLDAKVEKWITENVTTDFQDHYVVDMKEAASESLVAQDVRFDLDDDSEVAIGIPLVVLTEKSIKDKKKTQNQHTGESPDPVCLSPHFRLLRMCEQRQNGNLDEIDAVLGCPIFLPKSEVIDKIESLSTKEKDIICTALFHALNWFREIINAFATQIDPEMKGKVITRLHNITEVTKSLEKCLSSHSQFRPPPATFDWYENPLLNAPVNTNAEGKKKGRKPAKKKKGDKENIRDEDSDENSKDSSQLDTQNETQIPEKSETNEKPSVDMANYIPFFRELDISVFTILHTGLITKSSLDTELNTKGTTELSIQPPQLEFLLDDFTRKLSHALISSTSKRKSFLKTKADKNVGFSHLDQCTPKFIAKKVIKLLPALCEHLESSSGFFQTLIVENDGLIDGPGSNTPEAHTVGSCFCLLLQALQTLFAWNGFLMVENKSLLKEGLTTLMSRIKTVGSTQLSFTEVLKSSFQYIENFAGTVPKLGTAVMLIKVMLTLAEKSDSKETSRKTATVAQTFLKREWLDAEGQREKGAKHNENLHYLLRIYLCHCEDFLGAAEEITTKGVPDLLEGDKNGFSEAYPTLTKATFSVYYKTMFTELITCIKGIQPAKQREDKDAKLDKLLRWNQAVRILHIMVNLIKAFDGRGNLGTALKCGRQFIEIFLRQGMPLLDTMFRSNREDVQGLLKNLQVSTRVLHHMCGHSKIMKDIALTNQVPFLKKCLEAFVYRVKAMLTVNRCLEAFWLGNLKNRDLHGEEILSQASTVADTTAGAEEEEEEGEGESDGEESDVELDNQSNASDESQSIQY
ncbi:Fanconi anemia group D2 protein-like [Saccostrea echinata]|uniref:Fanconi anemia group D2 protein-like n=1 Tax=Saccostrea echinata TaxID=191078 RepID=UPI002A7F98ED|nr:Fanconi anemia group D2 protein-like [Saccostrea echinata]